ncbi:MAG: 50S ribosomal protein L29 [Phycisphaerae bacterium]|nr:50S ribosomal protein L29 [Phycisphaerae bacterium]
MKIEDVKKLSNDEIVIELERTRRHMFELRSQAVTEKLADPTRLTNARHDVARMLTVLRQREIEATKTV